MSEAYTRVLQGHVSFTSFSVSILICFFSYSCLFYSFVVSLCLFFIYANPAYLTQIAIDSAIFPEGTSGRQLDVLARKALWKDGMNYMVRLFKTKPKILLQLGLFF